MKLKLTQNRRLILRLLDEDYDENYPPPHSVSTLHYTLENIAQYKWEGYPDLATTPDIRNINRTCNDLLNAGYLVVNRVLTEPIEQGHLHYWEKHYQLATSVERNWISKECSIIHSKLQRAMFGVSLFGGEPFDVGLPKAEVKLLEKKVKIFIQKTHPDRSQGYEEQCKQMMECLGWLKVGIPLPEGKPKKDKSTKSGLLKNEVVSFL